jgi:hypothetical protein
VRVDQFNVLVRAAVARHPGTALVDLGARTSTTAGRYTASVAGIRLRYDGVHFTPSGGRWLWPWLQPQLDAVLRAAPTPVPAGRP